MKKIVLLLALMLSIAGSTFAANWQMIHSSPNGGSFIDQEKIMYDKNTDTAKMWVKNEFLDKGCYTLQEVAIKYTDNTFAMSSPIYIYTLNDAYVRNMDIPDINKFFPIPKGSSAEATKNASLNYVNRGK